MKKKLSQKSEKEEQKAVNYPYIPKGRVIRYVGRNNKFMVAAREATGDSGCAKQPIGAVLVSGGKVVAVGTNSSVKINVCPRILRGSKTGEDYHFCKDVCKQKSHSEVAAIRNAKENDVDTNGADLYLWGHWWCCEPCWNEMIAAGIKNVYLQSGSEIDFNPSSSIEKIYISGGLTFLDSKKDYRKIYENITSICGRFSPHVYVPHLCGTDPIKNPDVPAKTVWKKDFNEVSTSKLIIAYAGIPSLGVGAELEIAREASRDILLWWFKGEKVSRMARGNPAVVKLIECDDEEQLYKKIKTFLDEYKDAKSKN